MFFFFLLFFKELTYHRDLLGFSLSLLPPPFFFKKHMTICVNIYDKYIYFK